MWKITLEDDRLVFTPFFDEEPKKVSVSTLYGEMHPLPDWDPDKLREDLHNINEKNNQLKRILQDQENELQDLKLENDRLQQRDTIMWTALSSLACTVDCDSCLLKDYGDCGPSNMEFLAKDTLHKLEELG